MKDIKFKFNYNDINLTIKDGSFISIVGNNNDLISEYFKNKRNVNLITYKDLYNFKYDNVNDEIKNYIKNTEKFINDHNINSSINISEMTLCEKLKLKILISTLKSKIIVLDNLLNILDINEYKLILKILKSFTLKGNIVINITNISEETLFSDKIIIIYDNKLIDYDDVLTLLNKEKLMKKIGIGFPFIIELNKYLMDYDLIDKYYLSNKKLVGALWK